MTTDDPILSQMREIWVQVLERPIGTDTRLVDDAHAESLEVLELLECISDVFGVRVTVDDLFERATPRNLAKCVSARLDGSV